MVYPRQVKGSLFMKALVIVVLFLSLAFLQLLCVPETPAETFQIDKRYRNQNDHLYYFEDHLLPANGTDVFHITIEESEKFDKEIPILLRWAAGVDPERNITIYFQNGHIHNRTSEEGHEPYKDAPNLGLTYYDEELSLDKGSLQKFTLFVETRDNVSVNYKVYFETNTEPGVSPLLYWGMRVATVVGVLGLMTLLYWVKYYRPKHRKSFRSVRFSPQDLVLRWRKTLPKYRSNKTAQGSFVVNKKRPYASKPGDGTACCPGCRKILGSSENPYHYTRITFQDVGAPSKVRKVWRCIAIYCVVCGKLLDITK